MPVVELKTLGTLTKDQRAEITRRFTEVLEEVAGKPRDYIYVIIHEIDREHWGHRGKLFSDM